VPSYVHEQLKNKILHLELMPGTLLDETDISRQFGVSRSPVREALIRLSAEGLVQNFRKPHRHRGAIRHRLAAGLFRRHAVALSPERAPRCSKPEPRQARAAQARP